MFFLHADALPYKIAPERIIAGTGEQQQASSH